MHKKLRDELMKEWNVFHDVFEYLRERVQQPSAIRVLVGQILYEQLAKEVDNQARVSAGTDYALQVATRLYDHALYSGATRPRYDQDEDKGQGRRAIYARTATAFSGRGVQIPRRRAPARALREGH